MIVGEPQHWTLAFRNPQREAEYMQAYGREVRQFYRIVMIAILILWCASVGLDFSAPVGSRAPYMVIRFAVVAPIVLLAIALGFAPLRVYLRWWHAMAIGVLATIVGGTIALAAVASADVFAYTLGGFLLALTIGAGLDLGRAFYIFIVGVGLAAVMVVVIVMSPHTTVRDVMVDVLWVGVALAGAVIMSGRTEVARRIRFVQAGLLATEKNRSEALLRNLLPDSIAARLKDGPKTIADGLDGVTVLFADLKGFTILATQLTPEELVQRLDCVFSAFDKLAHHHGLEKIKTMGDAYMAVAGAPFARPDHAVIATHMALDMIDRLHQLEPTLALRIGLASGPVVAGVIGRSKLSYDLWGATVNLASRMESHGIPGRVQISQSTQKLLDATFRIEDRGEIELKGLGPTATFLIAAR